MSPEKTECVNEHMPEARQTAVLIQRKLIENFVSMARSTVNEEMLRATLNNTLDVSVEIAGAQTGSLFLLDEKGVVIDSILTSDEKDRERRSALLGTVLDKGLAGWVRLHRTLCLIEDTLTDDRWLTLPNQPYSVRSALAVPILRGNELIGIMTLLHAEPGALTRETAELMEVVSSQLALVLENTRLYAKLTRSHRSLTKAKKETEAYSRALDREMETGRQIQMDFLPDAPKELQGWQISTCFLPARQVSGDFYDLFFLQDRTMVMVIGDVCDKGVGAALYMTLFRSLIRIFSGQKDLFGEPKCSLAEPATATVDESLDHFKYQNLSRDPFINRALNSILLTNNYIAHNHGQKSMFATLFFSVLDLDTGCLTYINAGHEAPMLADGNGIKQVLKPTGPAVGLYPNASFCVEHTRINPGDIVIGVTDGVTEARSPGDQLYSKKRMATLIDQPVLTLEDTLMRLKTDLLKFIDQAKQSDDITIVSLYREPSNQTSPGT